MESEPYTDFPITGLLFPMKSELLACVYLAAVFSPIRSDRNTGRLKRPSRREDLINILEKIAFRGALGDVSSVYNASFPRKEPMEMFTYHTLRYGDYLWHTPLELFQKMNQLIFAATMVKVISAADVQDLKQKLPEITREWKNQRVDRWVVFDTPQPLDSAFQGLIYEDEAESSATSGEEASESKQGIEPVVYAVFLVRDGRYSIVFVSDFIQHVKHRQILFYDDFSRLENDYKVIGVAYSQWFLKVNPGSRRKATSEATETFRVGSSLYNAVYQEQERFMKRDMTSFENMIKWYVEGLFCPIYFLDYFVIQNQAEFENATKFLFQFLVYEEGRIAQMSENEVSERIKLLSEEDVSPPPPLARLSAAYKDVCTFRMWFLFIAEALSLWDDCSESIQRLMMAACYIPQVAPEHTKWFRQFTLFLMKKQAETGSSPEIVLPCVVCAFGKEAASALLKESSPPEALVDHWAVRQFQPVTKTQVVKTILDGVRKWNDEFLQCVDELTFEVDEQATRWGENNALVLPF